MKRTSAVSCLLLVAVMTAAACSSSRHDPRATQENFGVNMARMNLWREALFRFKRAVQMSPGDPMAHNNLAVAYEANGDFDNAAKEYREAMRLDKSNQYIQKNYSRFIEFTSRNKKRQKRDAATAPKAAAADATTSAPATPGAPAIAPEPAGTSGNAPGSSAQPTGTAPATTPPTASAPPAPAPPAPVPPDTGPQPPLPAKPPGDHS
jgi:hypothetical protein